MKFAIVILAAFALLLAGCTSSPPAAAGNEQAPEQQAAPPAAVPPAPGNDATPTMPPGAQVPPAPGNTVTPPAAPYVINTAQLATHNIEADCWVGYDGEVYDITTFIPNHKNYRELIVPLCGSSDLFKAKFEGKHGLSKVSILTGQPLMGALGQ